MPREDAESLEYIINIDNGEFARRLATAVDSNNVGEKTRMFQILRDVTNYSSDGHSKVLQILEQCQEIKRGRYRFGLLVDELRKAGSVAYRFALLETVNSVILGTAKIDDRVRLRNEFIGLKVTDILKDIAKECPDRATLAQLEKFEVERQRDEEELSAGTEGGVDLNSHLDLFHAVLKQVSESPQDVQFLSVLRHLLQIDPTVSLSDIIWDLIDKFVTRATLIDRKSDSSRVLADGLRKLDRALFFQNRTATTTASCAGKPCECSCHAGGCSGSNSFDSPLSPTARRRELNVPPAPPLPPFEGTPLVSPTNKSSGVRILPHTPDANDNSGSGPPAPPPPPGLNNPFQNVPPPPSFSAFSSAVNNIKLPQQLTPAPKSKVKKLQWNKISADKVVGRSNVWTAVGKLFPGGYTVNFDEMEELFGFNDKPATGAAGGGTDGDLRDGGGVGMNGAANGAQSERKKKPEEVNLLDAKRSMNVNIFLRQFRITHAELIRSLETGEGALVGSESLRGFLKIIPESDEIDLLKSYAGDRTRLGNAEKFYLELLTFPNYTLHAEALLVKEEFSQTLDWIKPCIDAVILSAKDIKESTSVQEIVYLVLVAGNFLNAGGYAGDAAGFKIGSLLKLTETRANKPGMTLMHYVVTAASQKNPKLLELPQQLKYLKEASQYSIESLTNDITSLRDKIKSISERIESANPQFRRQIKAFLETANKEMRSLEADLKEMELLRIELVEYFCEDEKSFKLDECFRIFSTFCDRFVKTIQENEQMALREEKAEERKKQAQDKTAVQKRRRSVDHSTNGFDDVGELLPRVTSFNESSSGSRGAETFSRGDVLRTSGRRTYESAAAAPLGASLPGALTAGPARNISIDERLLGVKDDKRYRRSVSGANTDELLDFLGNGYASEEIGGAPAGGFDRVGSLRVRRRRPRTPLESFASSADRERTTPSPASAAISGGTIPLLGGEDAITTGGSGRASRHLLRAWENGGEGFGNSRTDSPSRLTVTAPYTAGESSRSSWNGSLGSESSTLTSGRSTARASSVHGDSSAVDPDKERDRQRHLERLRRGRVTPDTSSSVSYTPTTPLGGISLVVSPPLPSAEVTLMDTANDATQNKIRESSSRGPTAGVEDPDGTLTQRALHSHSASRAWCKNYDALDLCSTSGPAPGSSPSDRSSAATAGELSPNTKRYGRCFDEDRNADAEEAEAERGEGLSSLQRSATLPRKWKNYPDLHGHEEEDGETRRRDVDKGELWARRRGRPENGVARLSSLEENGGGSGENGEASAHQESRVANVGVTAATVEEVRYRTNVGGQSNRKTADDLNHDANNARANHVSSTSSQNHAPFTSSAPRTGGTSRTATNGTGGGIAGGGGLGLNWILPVSTSPRSSRGSSQFETDSGRDEGFESESQRTSMCSTTEAGGGVDQRVRKDGHDTEGDEEGGRRGGEQARTFARSIDSLVLKPELVLTGASIDINDPPDSEERTGGLGGEGSDVDASDGLLQRTPTDDEEAFFRHHHPATDSHHVGFSEGKSQGSKPFERSGTAGSRTVTGGRQSLAGGGSGGGTTKSRSSFSARATINDITARLSQPKKTPSLSTSSAGANNLMTLTPSAARRPPAASSSSGGAAADGGTASPFVRRDKLRTTMPASMANTVGAGIKKRATPSVGGGFAEGVDTLDLPPEPPRRTSSIVPQPAAGDRLGLPASPGSTRSTSPASRRRTVSGQPSGHETAHPAAATGLGVAAAPMKRPSRFGNSSTTGRLGGTSKVAPTEGITGGGKRDGDSHHAAAEAATRNKTQSLFKKILAKKEDPSVGLGHRTQRIGMNTPATSKK